MALFNLIDSSARRRREADENRTLQDSLYPPEAMRGLLPQDAARVEALNNLPTNQMLAGTQAIYARDQAATPQGQQQEYLNRVQGGVEQNLAIDEALAKSRQIQQFGNLTGEQALKFDSNRRIAARGVQYGQELLDIYSQYGAAVTGIRRDELAGQAGALGVGLLNSARAMFEAGALAEEEFTNFQQFFGGDPMKLEWGDFFGNRMRMGQLQGYIRLLTDRVNDMNASVEGIMQPVEPETPYTRTDPPPGFEVIGP